MQHIVSRENKIGFTLIELSIVMVIIGLIVGGILAGKALIQQAEVRSAASKLLQFDSSYNAFRLKYNCIMGDCPNATDFFGANYLPSSGLCITMTNGFGNGDGNGFIDGGGGGWSCESRQAAKSLELSHLLPTAFLTPCWDTSIFKGINDGCAYFSVDDRYNRVTPPLKLNSMSWFYIAAGGYAGATMSPVITGAIDKKVDDGNPTAGKFRGLDSEPRTGGGIAVGSCVTSGAYNLNEDYTCRALYYFK